MRWMQKKKVKGILLRICKPFLYCRRNAFTIMITSICNTIVGLASDLCESVYLIQQKKYALMTIDIPSVGLGYQEKVLFKCSSSFGRDTLPT